MSTVEAAAMRAGDAAFMGHPRGPFYLAFTEAWERTELNRGLRGWHGFKR